MITVRQPEHIGCTAMDAINRAAVHRAAQPFLDWLRQADPTSVELSLEDLTREPTIYLLPEYATEEEARAHLKEFCSEIFELKNNLMAGMVLCSFSLAGRSGLRHLHPLV